MKFSLSRSKQTLGLLLVAFVLVSSAVGYFSESQKPSSPSAVPGLLGPYGVTGPSGPPPSIITMYSATASATGGPASYGGRMVEQEGYMTLEVADTKAASEQASNLAYSLGGYVASSSFDQAGSSSYVVLRVPQQNFTSALHELAALGRMMSQSVSSNDVTEEYVNLQAQLDAYQTEAATLIRILNSSKTVNDALSTEEALQQVQANINQIEGQLRVMQRLVAFATINLQLTTPPAAPELDLGDAIRSAIFSFYVVLKGMLILGAALAPIVVLGGVAYYPYRHFSKKKEKPIEAKLTGTG